MGIETNEPGGEETEKGKQVPGRRDGDRSNQ